MERDQAAAELLEEDGARSLDIASIHNTTTSLLSGTIQRYGTHRFEIDIDRLQEQESLVRDVHLRRSSSKKEEGSFQAQIFAVVRSFVQRLNCSWVDDVMQDSVSRIVVWRSARDAIEVVLIYMTEINYI